MPVGGLSRFTARIDQTIVPGYVNRPGNSGDSPNPVIGLGSKSCSVHWWSVLKIPARRCRGPVHGPGRGSSFALLALVLPLADYPKAPSTNELFQVLLDLSAP